MKNPKTWWVVKRLKSDISSKSLEWNIVDSNEGILIQEIDWKVNQWRFYDEEHLQKYSKKLLHILKEYKIELRDSKLNQLLN